MQVYPENGMLWKKLHNNDNEYKKISPADDNCFEMACCEKKLHSNCNEYNKKSNSYRWQPF
jgi:hypothetical protein